jgi:hypothetical protein
VPYFKDTSAFHMAGTRIMSRSCYAVEAPLGHPPA